MPESLITFFTTQWPAIAVLAFWGFFMTKYFMWVVDKKDQQNQANLDRFILLVEKTNDFMSKQVQAMDWLHPKLEEMHKDIKNISAKNYAPSRSVR